MTWRHRPATVSSSITVYLADLTALSQVVLLPDNTLLIGDRKLCTAETMVAFCRQGQRFLAPTPRTYLPFYCLPQPMLPGQRLQHLRHDRSSPRRDLRRYLVKARLGMLLAPLPQLIIHLVYRLLQRGGEESPLEAGPRNILSRGGLANFARTHGRQVLCVRSKELSPDFSWRCTWELPTSHRRPGRSPVLPEREVLPRVHPNFL